MSKVLRFAALCLAVAALAGCVVYEPPPYPASFVYEPPPYPSSFAAAPAYGYGYPAPVYAPPAYYAYPAYPAYPAYGSVAIGFGVGGHRHHRW
jgi:hypothetical protein